MLGAEHPDTLSTLMSLGRLQLQERKYPDAEATLRDALKTYDKARPEMWERYYCQSLLGSSLAGQMKFTEAEVLLLSGYEGILQRKDTVSAVDCSDVAEAGDRIVTLYRDWGKPEKAADWQQRLRTTKLADTVRPQHL